MSGINNRLSESQVKDGSQDDSTLGRLIDAIAADVRAGRSVDVEEVAHANPTHADELRRLLPALIALEVSGSDNEPARLHNVPSEILEGDRRLGDFRLVRELGRGGMGVVYEAEQLSLRRKVALKILPMAGLLDDRALQRFRNEATAAAGLEHPNVVPVYGVGCERGVHYMSMRLIDGPPLSEVVRRARVEAGLETVIGARANNTAVGVGARDSNALGATVLQLRDTAPSAESSREAADTQPMAALSTERSPIEKGRHRTAAKLIRQAADALEYAHSLGVIHRDIKPSNLLLDTKGNVWVADFGLAHLEGDTSLTMTGDVMGTLRYMSPEQASGRRGLADHRSDIYSLGVTLYELLTLRPAFSHQDRVKLLKAVIEEEPLSPRNVDPSIPRDLETVVLKAIAKEPVARYETAKEMAEDLRRFLDHEPIRAKRPGLIDRGLKWSRRHQSLAAAAFLGFILVTMVSAVGTVLISAAYQRESQQRRLAEEAVRREKFAAERSRIAALRADASFRDALAAVDEMLLQVGDETLKDIPQMEPVRRRLLQRASAFYEGFLKQRRHDPSVRKDVIRALRKTGDIHQFLADSRAAEVAYRGALSVKDSARAGQPDADEERETARTYGALAMVLRQSGRFADAEAAYDDAIRRLQALAHQGSATLNDRSWLAAFHTDKAALLTDQGRLADADVELQKAVRNCEAIEAQDPSVIEGVLTDSLLAAAQSESLTAEDHRRRKAGMLRVLANLEWRANRTRDAFRHSSESVDLLRTLAEAFPASARYRFTLLATLGVQVPLLVETGSVPEAERVTREAIQIAEQLVSDFPRVPDYQRQLGGKYGDLSNILQLLGRSDEAIEAAKQSIRIAVPLGLNYPGNTEYGRFAAVAAYGLASRLQDHRDTNAALVAWEEALPVCRRLVEQFPTVPEHVRILRDAAGNYGKVLSRAEGYSAAKTALEEALTLAARLGEQVSAEDLHRAAEYRIAFSSVLVNLEEVQEAERQAALAVEVAREAVLSAGEGNAVGKYRRALSHALSCWGTALVLTGRAADADERHREAIEVASVIAAADPSDVESRIQVAKAHLYEGQSLELAAQFDRAAASFARSAEAYESLAEIDPNAFRFDALIARNGQATQRRKLGQHSQAMDSSRIAYAEARKLLEQQKPLQADLLDAIVTAHVNMAACLRQRPIGTREELMQVAVIARQGLVIQPEYQQLSAILEEAEARLDAIGPPERPPLEAKRPN